MILIINVWYNDIIVLPCVLVIVFCWFNLLLTWVACMIKWYLWWCWCIFLSQQMMTFYNWLSPPFPSFKDIFILCLKIKGPSFFQELWGIYKTIGLNFCSCYIINIYHIDMHIYNRLEELHIGNYNATLCLLTTA